MWRIHVTHLTDNIFVFGWRYQPPLNSRSFIEAVMVSMKFQNRVVASDEVLALRSWCMNSKRLPSKREHLLLLVLCNTPDACLCVQRILAIPSDTSSTQVTWASISKPSCVRMADPNAPRPILKHAQFLFLDPSLTCGGCGLLVSSHSNSITSDVLIIDWTRCWSANTQTSITFVVWLIAHKRSNLIHLRGDKDLGSAHLFFEFSSQCIAGWFKLANFHLLQW